MVSCGRPGLKLTTRETFAHTNLVSIEYALNSVYGMCVMLSIMWLKRDCMMMIPHQLLYRRHVGFTEMLLTASIDYCPSL